MRELKRLNAWIDGASLRDIDTRLYITEIYEPEPDVTLDWGISPGISGQRKLRRTRQAKKVRIEFDIKELFDLKARAAIVDAANGWAHDGILTISTRPEQRMRAVLTQAATMDGARDVTAKYIIEFTAGACPYWEDETPRVLSLASGTSGSGTLIIPGHAPTGAEITVTPGASLSTLSLTIQGQTMAFSGLSVASGTALVIGHDDNGLLTIKAGTASKLSCRTAASVDDFRMVPGSAAVSFTANAACTVSVSVRGRYL